MRSRNRKVESVTVFRVHESCQWVVSEEANNHAAIWAHVTGGCFLASPEAATQNHRAHTRSNCGHCPPIYWAAQPFHDVKTTWSYHDPYFESLTTSESSPFATMSVKAQRIYSTTRRHAARGYDPRWGRCACMQVTWDLMKNNQIRCLVSHGAY
jgi:hypothetical protein